MVEESKTKDFETYLISALNDSLLKKSNDSKEDISSLRFESWWMEGREKNMITVLYRLDGNPHEVTIKDTKYFVKELYACEKHKSSIVTCWDLFVGAKIDIFGKPTVMKQCDLKTAEWNKFYGSFLNEMKNTFLEELRKYERKALEPKLTKACEVVKERQCAINLRELITQVASLKQRLTTYRPLLSDDIIVAFESLL